MITSDATHIATVLSEKFESLHQAFADLNAEAANFHRELNLNDKASRAKFDALSRTLGFCDQLHLVLTIMREDIRELAPVAVDFQAAPWNDQLDECLEEWLRTACLANPTVH